MRLINLDETKTLTTSFDVVAVVVAVDGPRQIRSGSGDTAVLTNLSLSDSTSHMSDVTLTLWNSCSVRAASLRMLDIVHVHDAIVKQRSEHNGRCIFKLSLNGASARVRMIEDDVVKSYNTRIKGIQSNADRVITQAWTVLQWRNHEFQVLCTLRQEGRIWSGSDQVRHGEVKPIQAASASEKTTITKTQGAQPKTTLQSVVNGTVTGWREIERIKVEGVYVETRRDSGKETWTALRESCWYGCGVCRLKEERCEEEQHKQCVRCGGEMHWRYGAIVVRLRDESGSVLGKVSEDDAVSLLLGTDAAQVVTDEATARWVGDVLTALVVEPTPFTALVCGMGGNAVALRRLFIFNMYDTPQHGNGDAPA